MLLMEAADFNKQQTCSFSLFTNTPCTNTQDIYFIKDCSKPISSHLRSLNISYDDKFMSEGLLICSRVGIFSRVPYLTVCQYHRASLGLQWKRRSACVFPGHTGKCKGDRPISTQDSYAMAARGILLPVGSAICKFCRKKIASELESFPDITDVMSDQAIASCDHKVPVECPTDDHMQNDHDSELQQDLILNSQASATANAEFSSSQTESDIFIASVSSSQVSSWSVENQIHSREALDALQRRCQGKISPISYQIRKDVDKLAPSTIRQLKRKAATVVEETLDLLAPNQAKKVWRLINQEMPPESPKIDSLVLQLYKETNDKNSKTQFLSMIANNYSKEQLKELLPGITTYTIDKARRHAKEDGKGVPLPDKEKFLRNRMDQDKLDHAIDFFLNPAYHQVSSYGVKEMHLSSGVVVTIPQVVRTACHATLVNMYQSYCEETDFHPLSRASLYRILNVCPASKQTSLKGLDNIAADGGTGFDSLFGVLENLKPYLTQPDRLNLVQEIKDSLLAFRCYLKTDFRAHIQRQDKCSTHCIQHALSDPTDKLYSIECENHCHDFCCDRCDLFPRAIEDMKNLLKDFEGDVPAETSEEFNIDVQNAELKILDWQRHVVRTVNQDLSRTELLDSLSKNQCLLVMDWAMKFLPLSFREKQSDWFGQKGINWHVIVCIYKTEDNQFKHRTYTHCLEGTKQDWHAVAVLLGHALTTIKHQLPFINTAFLRSDNAGCYHCGALWFTIPSISEATGITIKRYDFSESQSGKSYCDAKIAHMRAKIRKSVAEGRNVLTAADMKSAIDSYGGVAGCQVAHVEILNTSSKPTGLIKGISKISNVEFTDDGHLVTWKAYGIGAGRKITVSNSNRIERKLKAHSDFKEPRNKEGTLTYKPSDEGTLGCPDGCSDAFTSFSAMYDHCLVGKHNHQLQKMSTFDKIKLRWYDNCMNLTEGVAIQRSYQSSSEESAVVDKGWAMKKARKHVRFSEKVVQYLCDIFQAGEESGNKMNAHAVSKNMRVAQENGCKKFSAYEFLEPTQITSYFSKLAAEKKIKSKAEEDIESAVALIEQLEAMEEVTSLLS